MLEWRGERIGRAGLYTNIPIEMYHSQEICVGPSVSSSNLRRALEINGGSPAHFYNEWSGNMAREETDDRPHFTLGRAAHHLLLGDATEMFVMRPERWKDWRSKEAQEWRDMRKLEGKTVLTDSEIKIIGGMAKSLGLFELTKPPGLLGGRVEHSLIWRDEETGLWIKARPDAIPTDSGDFADLKTTTSVQLVDLKRTVNEFAYHQQAALTVEGAQRLGIPVSSFSFVFVEKAPPYCVRVIHLDERALAIGHDQNHSAMRLIARCLKEQRFPGPGDGNVLTVNLPDWYRDRAIEAIAEEKNAAYEATH